MDSAMGAGGDADTVLKADQKHTAEQALNIKVKQPRINEYDSQPVESSPIPTAHSFPSIPESLKTTANPISPLPTKSPHRSIAFSMEDDVAWLLTDSVNVLTPYQRYDAISIVHMVSPRTFMVVSQLGNVKPAIGRFLAVKEALTKTVNVSKRRHLPCYKRGIYALIFYEGEYARAVLLSKIPVRPGYFRFACLDINAVVDVPSSNVFKLPRRFDPSVVPCNLFLARIHGIQLIKKDVVQKYFDRFNDQKHPMATVCVIRSVHSENYLEIDFVLDGQWISETLLSQNHAIPWLSSTQISKPSPSPTVVRHIVKTMIETGTYDFPPNGSIFNFAGISFIRPEVYPGYDVVLKKISPDSSIIHKNIIEEPKITEEMRSEADESPPLRREIEPATDPWNDVEKVQQRLNELKEELDVIRAGTTEETHNLHSYLITTALMVSSHSGSVWTQQLTALVDELQKSAFSSNPI